MRLLTFHRAIRASLILLGLSLPAAQGSERGTAPDKLLPQYDVVIAGAGTGGFGTAVQAARMGATVLLLEETDWIGGQMNAAAVTSMDEGPTLVRERGLYHEFVEAVSAHYQKLGMTAETAYGRRHICMEPRVGQDILYDFLADARSKTKALHVSLRSKVTAVQKKGDAISGVTLEIAGAKPRQVQCQVLVDATEWGDVIPLTGARYRVGNCLSDAEIVPARNIQDCTWTATVKQFPKGVPAALVLKAEPPDYAKYKARFTSSLVAGEEAGPSSVRPWNWGTFIGYRAMPNSEQPTVYPITRTHLNFNNDFPVTIGDVQDPATRTATMHAAIIKTLGLLYYLQHDLGKGDWSVADDEGFDTPFNREQMDALIREQPALEPYRPVLYHFSIMAYARESRRIVGLHTLTAHEIERKPGRPVQFPNGVALGDYAVDLHGSKKPELLELDLDPEKDIPRESFGQKGVGPFSIPFECFIPEKVDGFLPAEKNFSQSRLTNGATRLQPSTMLMGQAVGTIAALSVQRHVAPRAVPPVLVQQVLLRAGDTLLIPTLRDVAKTSWEWAPIQFVCTRGLMAPNKDVFDSAKPLTSADAEIFLRALSLQVDPAIATLAEVKRADLAAALSVKVSGDVTQPITRLEAARVLAAYVEARAGGTPFTWPEQRDPTPVTLSDLNPQGAASLQLLADRKIIPVDSIDYWLVHAVEGGQCDGERVHALLVAATQAVEPGSKPEEMYDVAKRAGFMGQPSYWEKMAVPGGKCRGDLTATVLKNIAMKVGAEKR